MSDFYRLPVADQAEILGQLAVVALEHWDVSGCEPALIKFRENAVFRVVAPDGRAAALRIHRHGYHSDAALRSELAWMRALQTQGMDVPGVVPTRTGELFTMATVDGIPEARQVDMLTWLPGTPFGGIDTGLDPAITDVRGAFEKVGRLAAQLHEQAEAWQRPDGFVRHAWDIDGLLGEQPVWGRFWELAAMKPAERRLIEQARTRARDDLMAFGRSSATYGLIHADMVVENLLRDGDRVKLIDFDDASFGWHLFDLATTWFFFRGTETFDRIRDGVIAGYRSVRALPDEQLERMPLFDAVRGFTYLGWVHTRYETKTARELAPVVVALACDAAERYLGNRMA